VATQELVMLPTDMALRTDPEFRQYAELYARDEAVFFQDFASAYGKMLSNGCPFHAPKVFLRAPFLVLYVCCGTNTNKGMIMLLMMPGAYVVMVVAMMMMMF